MENSCRKKHKPSPKKWILASRYPEFRRNPALIPANAGLFHYAGNCPVRYIDPDGKKIVFCKSATAEQIESYKNAVVYLKQSARAKELIEKLEGAPEVFTIDFIESTNDRYDWDLKTIKWNPKTVLL